MTMNDARRADQGFSRRSGTSHDDVPGGGSTRSSTSAGTAGAAGAVLSPPGSGGGGRAHASETPVEALPSAADRLLAFTQHAGIALLPWQITAIRAVIDGPIVTIGGRQGGKSRPETPPAPPTGGHPGAAGSVWVDVLPKIPAGLEPKLAIIDEPRRAARPAPKPHPGKHRVTPAPRASIEAADRARERIRMVLTDPETGKVIAQGDAERHALEQLARGERSVTLGGPGEIYPVEPVWGLPPAMVPNVAPNVVISGAVDPGAAAAHAREVRSQLRRTGFGR